MDVRLDWYGCATFRMRAGGLTVFLDAYIDRVPRAQGTGLTADDVDHADWILVGHSHFDHLWGAERIARNTGAVVVGSYETVRVMAAEGVPEGQLMPVAGGERIRLADEVYVSVLPSLHSCVWSQAGRPPADQVCLGDLGVPHQERLARSERRLERMASSLDPDALGHLRVSQQGVRGDGGPLVYLLETPAGTLLYQDTSGCWTGVLRDLRPDVAVMAAAGRGNIDGEPVQGSLADFVAGQAELIRPGKLILCHHDDWLPDFTAATDVTPIRKRLAERAPQVDLAELDYLDAHPVFG